MKINLIYASCILLFSHQSDGCPTCVGRVTNDSPPFFSQEFHDMHVHHQSFEKKNTSSSTDNQGALQS